MTKKCFISMAILFLPILVFAQGPTIGVGVSGGLNYPLVQDDQGAGSTFGFRGIFKVLPVISVEPNLHFTKNGDPDLGVEGVTNDLEGSKITSYGIDAKFGAPLGSAGFQPFATLGFGFFKSTRDQTKAFVDNKAIFGWVAGLGFAVGVAPNIAIDVRGKFNIVPSDGSGSRKSVFAMGGLNYFFGGK